MKIIYRPEIDGLRAIAVIAVILYHTRTTFFGYEIFQGGFIGVDVFFVISGYLITSIIFKELVITGSFSFKHFYERRVRRIIPALLFVMLASLPFAWAYLLEDNLIDFSKSILYSLGFISNFYFYSSGQLYGATGDLLKPFLHTWSLSIEEQYYILFPIILIITFKYFRKYLGIILILGFILSLIVADWGSKNHPSFNWYVLPTRGWELIAGSILAYYEITLGKRLRSKYESLNLILPSVGLFLICFSILLFNDKMFHPSFYSLPPIIGVCLIIWFTDKGEIISKILSSKLLVGIGLISYSLYLWHYPIFAFNRLIEFTSGDVFKKILLGFVLFLFSIFSYYLIERPARDKKYKFKMVLMPIIVSSLILIIFNLIIIKNDGYKVRIPKILQENLLVKNGLVNSKNEYCLGNVDGCAFNLSSKKKIFIIGDSQMDRLSYNLKNRVVDIKYQFITSTVGGCLYYPGFDLITVKTQKIDKKCNSEYFFNLEEKLKKEKNSIIIFGGRLPKHLTNYWFDNKEGGVEGEKWDKKYLSNGKFENIQSSFYSSIINLSKSNKIILIYPIPEVGWHVTQKILNQYPRFFINSKKITFEKITTSFEVYKERTQSSFELLDSIKGDNIYRIYPHKLFCDTLVKDRCVTSDDQNLYYIDFDHPSTKGSEMINDLIIDKILLIK